MPTARSSAPRRRRVTALVLIAGAALMVQACSRAVAVGTTPATTYAVNVTNAAGTDLAVSYDDGSGPRALGLVAAGRTERFIIAAPRQTTVRITGSTPDGSRTAAPVEVQLQIGAAVGATLR